MVKKKETREQSLLSFTSPHSPNILDSVSSWEVMAGEFRTLDSVTLLEAEWSGEPDFDSACPQGERSGDLWALPSALRP